MVGPFGEFVPPFRSTSRKWGRHHHDEVAWRWCRWNIWVHSDQSLIWALFNSVVARSRSSKLPVGPWPCWTVRLAYQDRSNTPLRRRTQSVSPSHYKAKAHLLIHLETIFLTTVSFARLLRFPQNNWPFPTMPAVNCSDFTATFTAFFRLLIYAG